ncbi:MAG: DUF2062 domain-containing protein [Gammaproteobacteria bacterium]|nr:MAG: DUF2062 domain-containing protein [Gammaproteobacteria bacterium]
MARNLLKRFIPTQETIKNNPTLRRFEKFLHDPNLFHLNRHSVSVAFFWGLLIAILPVPGQMPLAALAALIFRCNLPIAVALAWVSNPFTTPFILLLSYKLGAFLLQSDPLMHHPNFNYESLTASAGQVWEQLCSGNFRDSWNWLIKSLGDIWKPLSLGLLVTGLLSGALGYFVMQIFWRLHVARAWSKRKIKRGQVEKDKPL